MNKKNVLEYGRMRYFPGKFSKIYSMSMIINDLRIAFVRNIEEITLRILTVTLLLRVPNITTPDNFVVVKSVAILSTAKFFNNVY